MAITATNTTTDFEKPADGIYEATFSGWEEPEPHPAFGPGVKLIWQLPDGNDKWQFCSQKLSPKATLRIVVQALGAVVSPGKSYELDDLLNPLVGSKAQILIKTGEDGRQKVTDILPAKGGQKAAPAPSDDVGDCFICEEPGTAFDGRGRPVCEAHKSVN